jgi:hypothetical protein
VLVKLAVVQLASVQRTVVECAVVSRLFDR